METAMSDFREKIDNLDVRGISSSSVVTAFGLVVALNWKDAINALMGRIIPSGSASSLLGQFIAGFGLSTVLR